jgi:hypothetical protein
MDWKILPDTDNNNAHGQPGGLDDCVHSLAHVGDLAVGKDHQDLEQGLGFRV